LGSHEQDDRGAEEAGRHYREEQEEAEMPYTVSGTDIRGVNTARRRTPELALKKAREFIGAPVTMSADAGRPDLPFRRVRQFPERPRHLPPKHASAAQARPAATLAKAGETSQGSSLFQKKPA
jgi:hypothetical protein